MAEAGSGGSGATVSKEVIASVLEKITTFMVSDEAEANFDIFAAKHIDKFDFDSETAHEQKLE